MLNVLSDCNHVLRHCPEVLRTSQCTISSPLSCRRLSLPSSRSKHTQLLFRVHHRCTNKHLTRLEHVAYCLCLSSVHDALAGYNWTTLPTTTTGTGYTVLLCRQGTFVTSLTAYVSSNHYSNTGSPNYLGERHNPTLTAVTAISFQLCRDHFSLSLKRVLCHSHVKPRTCTHSFGSSSSRC